MAELPRPVILLVEDEPEIRRFLRAALEADGYRSVESPSGRRGTIDAATHKPDLAIIDLGLPDTTGQDLLRRWRAGGNDVPVLILSSRTDEAGIVEALELGADDYLTKPFGVKELVARIRNALRHRLQAQGERALFQSGDLTVDLVRRIVRLGVERQHVHAEPLGDPDNPPSDPPGADHAKGLAVEIEASQAALREVSAPGPFDGFHEMTAHGEQEGEGMLRDRMVPVVGNVADRHSVGAAVP